MARADGIVLDTPGGAGEPIAYDRTMSAGQVEDAYAARANEYIELFGTIEAAAQQDREHVLTWANGIDGRIMDVGCGPGHWTNYLRENGVDIEGIDPVPEFIQRARRQYPRDRFRIGRADQLGVGAASLGAVLSWFSLIHAHPDAIDGLLAELARCTRPGGGLLIGFFEGPSLIAFDHAVSTAYFWPMDVLGGRLEQAGFVVTDARARTDPGVRRQGTITARRREGRPSARLRR